MDREETLRVYNSLRKQLAPIMTPEYRRVLDTVGKWAAGENSAFPAPKKATKKAPLKAKDYKALMNRPK